MRIALLFMLILLAGTSFAQRRRLPQRFANDPERLAALRFLLDVDTVQQSAYWPHIRAADFVRNVRRNVAEPYKMNTGRNTNFCAFGAVSFTCLKNEPLRYAQCMIELYRNGRAMYRDIRLEPSEAIRNAAGQMIFQGDLDISPADQAWYLSLAHRFKGYLNFFNKRYEPGDENTMWAATNLAKFNRMLRRLCKYKVGSRGADLVRPGINDLPAFLQEKLGQGEVYLYLNNSLLRKKNHNRLQKWIPTHYAVLLEIYPDADGELMLRYWDGGYQTVKEVSARSLKQITYGVSWVNYNEQNGD